MIDINNYIQTGNFKYYCLFRFTFKFNFYVQVALPDFYRSLDRAIMENQEKTIGNNFVENYFSEKACQRDITSNVYDVTREYKNDKIIFEYSEFADQQILYPNTNQIAVSFAVILKSCLDVIKQYASNQPKNILVDLEFEFSTNATTYHTSIRDIWGNQIIPSPLEIRNGAKFNEVLDSQTDPIGILKKFFQQYVYHTINRFLSVGIDTGIAQATWDKIFNK